ncbi:MAG: lipoyl(octanoyl) transferase [Bdellovibrio sp. CG12_big_fil_rev_8_21_14_0_65_39_13]|nr:MAG: lipoyl(octanoyl) transferase [Bdellovibrio sp. CG22_combo_CG10-13_8_21_14_all_39_27]PIQ61180.1 MAG: lipoyl(octanoyl) transferase [Bdellovibrio sp. CG12_big_fil_rev_8_21_14_0_65_39_13]PIR34850.1 MAG: lipoyl(octanoyl) transferase [Bdellovibrio sp. CG11_big_fil_rev_8_21_14_0_20_39_38]PJB54645.1 MAG: lipoyl(octanoyl) transferase [Bdellovibrio sp. CG_4_9_14_3_um_filter_39_7]
MKILNLGLLPYQSVYQTQLENVEAVRAGAEDTLIVCSHPPIVTLGKKTQADEHQFWTGQTLQIERGGRSTYHGPNQVIIYPILNLNRYQQNLSGFLEAMENSMIEVLKQFDLQATGNPDRGNPDLTGIWVGPRKIASIGIAVKRWVTYHGLALNLEHDPLAFQGINPCGKDSSIMTSLEQEIGQKVERSSFEAQLCQILIQRFQEMV